MLSRKSAEKLLQAWFVSRPQEPRRNSSPTKRPPLPPPLPLLLAACTNQTTTNAAPQCQRVARRPDQSCSRATGWRQGPQINPAKVVGDLFCLNVELSYFKHVDMYISVLILLYNILHVAINSYIYLWHLNQDIDGDTAGDLMPSLYFRKPPLLPSCGSEFCCDPFLLRCHVYPERSDRRNGMAYK